PCEAEEVVGALEVARVRREALAAVRRLVQPVALDHRAHRPVEDEDASAEEVVKLGGAVGLRHECLQKTKRPAKFAGPLESLLRSGSLAFFILVASGPAISFQVRRSVPRREPRNPAADVAEVHRLRAIHIKLPDMSTVAETPIAHTEPTNAKILSISE